MYFCYHNKRVARTHLSGITTTKFRLNHELEVIPDLNQRNIHNVDNKKHVYKDIDIRHKQKPVVFTNGCLQANQALSLAFHHQNDRDYDISGTNLRAPTSNTLLPYQKQHTVTSGADSDRRFPILVSEALRNLCQSERSTKFITNLTNAHKEYDIYMI